MTDSEKQNRRHDEKGLTLSKSVLIITCVIAIGCWMAL